MKVIAKIADAFFKAGKVNIKLSIEGDDILALNIKKKEVSIKILSLLGSLGLGLQSGLKGVSAGSELWNILNEMGYKLTFE